MYSKIAIGNIKKSFKDYAIYFLTLTFAVCVFYAFNSIGSQQAMLKLSTSQAGYIKTIEQSMSAVSVFVSVVLGALIIYANNFLIKRRKKELGVYTTLGMGKGKISRILVLETFIVGIISLVVGLIIGLIVSQGLSLFTAKLFGTTMSKYSFIISTSAIIKTVMYFGLIFLLVMIFNTVIISKYKLIDLLTAGKKNENIKVKNPILLVVIFILGVLGLIGGYAVVIKYGLNDMNKLYLAVGLGFVGTFLFFYGLSGFVVLMIQRNKNIYLRGLNIFVTKQMNNKINTNFISMGLISLMLFITITALSTGLALKTSLANAVKENTPFYATLNLYGSGEESATPEFVQNLFKEAGMDLNKNFDVDYIKQYNPAKGEKFTLSSEGKSVPTIYPYFISLTDYNNYKKMIGEKPVTLQENQAIVTSNVSQIADKINPALETGAKIKLGDKTYEVENKKAEKTPLQNSMASSNPLTIVLADSQMKGLEENTLLVNMNEKTGVSISEDQIQEVAAKMQKIQDGKNEMAYPVLESKQGIINANEGMTSIILYITIYLGVIFLLTSAAVLALQQLLEASDSIDRYKTLRKIGVTNKMINKAVFKQVLIHFSLPLGLALIDSAVGIYVVSQFIEAFGKSSIVVSSLATVGVIIVIYGGYMYSTYIGFKNVVKE